MRLFIRTMLMSISLLLLLFASSLLPLAPGVAALPPGFVKEFVVNRPATTGRWAGNPRNDWKPMLIIASDSGKMRVLENPDESEEAITILDLRLEDEEICTNGERGLQSVAVHPSFEENLFVYVFYTGFREGCLEGPGISPSNVVDRYRMDPDTLELDKDTKKEIFRVAPGTKQNHNGGAIAFGNDGKLYVTTGDGGDGDSVQPLDNTHGCIIRLNDDGSVPSDNPFADPNKFNGYRCADSEGSVPKDAPDGAVCSEIFANGLRNPFRIQMDPNEKEKVRIAVSDVGGNHWEELSWAGTDYAGRNYGYPDYEGPCLHGHSDSCRPPTDDDDNNNNNNNALEPFHWYAHRELREGGCVAGSVIVPNDSGWPPEYKFLFADFIFFEIYNLIEDPDAYCRTCIPPLPAFRNETFYKVPEISGEKRGSITDIVFGPYKNTQALYVFLRGGNENVIRIRYTSDTDNSPPIPVIGFNDRGYSIPVGEKISFDGSKSSDPDGDDLKFEWDFGDGSASESMNPKHSFREPGEYEIRLVVTDTAGISQQTTTTITVGNPPTVSILSPTEGDEFFVGQIFRLRGEAFDFEGKRLDNSSLTWEVRKHHADHFHPFLDPTRGNGLELFPAPEPEDFLAATNSYLQIILKATDKNGLTTEVDRLVQPMIIGVNILSNPPDMQVLVDAYPLVTNKTIVSWKSHRLKIFAKDQPSHMFRSWWDGNTEPERQISLREDGQSVVAIYCAAAPDSLCTTDEDCCSGSCRMSACAPDTVEISNDSEEFIVNKDGDQDDSDSDSNSNDYEEHDRKEVITQMLSPPATVSTTPHNGLGRSDSVMIAIAIASGICLIIAARALCSSAKEKAQQHQEYGGGKGDDGKVLSGNDEEMGPFDTLTATATPHKSSAIDPKQQQQQQIVDEASTASSGFDVLDDTDGTSSSGSSE